MSEDNAYLINFKKFSHGFKESKLTPQDVYKSWNELSDRDMILVFCFFWGYMEDRLTQNELRVIQGRINDYKEGRGL